MKAGYTFWNLFSDRVEIRNPGSLYGGLTLEDLRRKEHVSRRRNPLVADLLRRIHMVEGWGRGMPLILENEPSAEFRETAQIFITVFKRKSLQIKGNVHVGSEGNTTTNTTTKTTIKNLAADINPNSSKGKILALISYNPSISLDELASSVNLTKRWGSLSHQQASQNGPSLP